MYPVTLIFPPETYEKLQGLTEDWKFTGDGKIEVTFNSFEHGAFLLLMAGVNKLVPPEDASAIRDAAARYYDHQGYGATKGSPVVLSPPLSTPAAPPPIPEPSKQNGQISLL